jgi:hypothetical protein
MHQGGGLECVTCRAICHFVRREFAQFAMTNGNNSSASLVALLDGLGCGSRRSTAHFSRLKGCAPRIPSDK